MSDASDAQRVADGLPDGIVVADGSGTVRFFNEAAGRLLGVRRRDAVGAPLAEVLALADTDGRSWCEVNRPWDGLRTRSGVPEQAWLAASGEEVLVTARIQRDEHLGDPTGVSLSLRSGRGRERLDRERSDLVATVAHELRSPLSGVKGFVQVMLNRWEQLQDEQKKLMLTTVLSDADRLSRLIAELLDVARIDTGRLSMAPRPVDARILVRRVVGSVQAGTKTPIEYHEPAELPAAWADPDKLTQVMTNLIENGVRHGQGTVRVSTLPGEDGAGVRLVVRDEGPGIPPEMRRRVFTKYWTGGTGGGSGLGLYLVNGLVRAHGGTLTVDDAEGGGAELVVDWPGPPD